MSFDKEFYAAKAKGGQAFADVITKARALGYDVREGCLTKTGKVKAEPAKPARSSFRSSPINTDETPA